jgi:arabinose-5-phosphate isomerase
VHQTKVEQVMTSGGISLSTNSLAIDALNLMQEKRINALIVTDADQKPVGALSMHMLLRAGVV